MELTDEILVDLGFKKGKSFGGQLYWYHNRYLGETIIPYKKGVFESNNSLAFDPGRQDSAKTLKELFEIMLENFYKAFHESGSSSKAQEIRSALNLD